MTSVPGELSLVDIFRGDVIEFSQLRTNENARQCLVYSAGTYIRLIIEVNNNKEIAINHT